MVADGSLLGSETLLRTLNPWSPPKGAMVLFFRETRHVGACHSVSERVGDFKSTLRTVKSANPPGASIVCSTYLAVLRHYH
jgi:hypothetical protein